MVLPVLLVFMIGAATGVVANTEYSPKIDNYLNEHVLHNEESK